MPPCPSCLQFTAKHRSRDSTGRQRFLRGGCRRSFTRASASAFAGSRWPPEVILMAVRWHLAQPLSATSVLVSLAERGSLRS